ncbi:MAG: ABC transporter substrate-binding protein [Patescibacteria group bacterium]
MRRSQVIIISIVGVLVVGFALLYFGIIPGFKSVEKIQPVSLNFWGVGDDRTAFSEVIYDYQQSNPHVKINYKQLNEANYEQELLNAMAANEPIDIIMFQSTWLPKHFDKIIPVSPMQFSFTNFQNLFPTVAIQDFAPDQIIYALPLYMDTLAMIYNRDIFDSKAIAIPPRNWGDFQNVVSKLKKPVAIGGTNKSIANATDLLSLLFLQSGSTIVDPQFKQAIFSLNGDNVVSFYTQFANPKSPSYAWKDSYPYSINDFAAGNTAIIFAYQDQLKKIAERSPFISYGIAPVPQPTASAQTVNWAKYRGLAVVRNSGNPEEAWKFILFLTTNATESEKYLKKTGRAPALRSLINKYLDDQKLGVFARQALSARSYPQVDDKAIGVIFSDMINSILTNQLSPYSAVIKAEGEMNQLISRRKR